MSQQPHLPHMDETPAAAGPVTCLGLTFPDDAARRAYFTERLAEHLQDPAFRQIEGFPLGADADILALSDPPWYTACPNPFLGEIIAQWQREREETRAALGLPAGGENGAYQREPFAADVSEGKNDPIYNAHSYHTKVPHKAIMRYILHYTDPGDIVFDGFCGTGMTGVAAQLCGDRKAVESLGYYVDADGLIYETLPSPSGRGAGGEGAISRLGPRKAVLNDLSPAATFIAYNYNTPVDTAAFEAEARRILAEVEGELGWMYETWHPHCDHPQRVKARINYTVWSDVFVCPDCGVELVLWEIAVDDESRRVSKSFSCSDCGGGLSKGDLIRATETIYDSTLETVLHRAKRKPVLINYQLGNSRLEKAPDLFDLSLLEPIATQSSAHFYPTRRIEDDIDLWYERDYRSLGIYTVDAFFTKRSLILTSFLWDRARKTSDSRLRAALVAWIQSVTMGFSLLNRYLKNAFSQVNRILSGTLYVGSFVSEVSPWYALRGKIAKIGGMSVDTIDGHAVIATASTAAINGLPPCSLDYVFIDPPFGENIIYSDLSIIWESWLRLGTNTRSEAVVHRRKKAGHKIDDYQAIMRQAFSVVHTALKPGRWMTVEFHNTSNAVWNAIQEAMLRAGFVVADVRTMDKQLATFKQVTTDKAVKQDLIISAYKPTVSFERSFQRAAGTAEGAWHFVRQHLDKLPVVVHQEGVLETLGERQDYLLFDRMVAFHIQRGATVPLSAAEFYAGLRSRFVERDGMFFLPDQVPEYDRARLQAGQVAQLTLFVNDEKSSVQWLRQQLDPTVGGQPQSYQELQPQFLRQLHQARHEALPELSALLEQNFLQDDQGRWYLPDPNRASDLEALRLKGLLREFRGYLEGKKKLKQFRSEAVRAGFAQAWRERDFASIVAVAERLPEQVLQEDAELLMYYDNASLRVK